MERKLVRTAWSIIAIVAALTAVLFFLNVVWIGELMSQKTEDHYKGKLAVCEIKSKAFEYYSGYLEKSQGHQVEHQAAALRSTVAWTKAHARSRLADLYFKMRPGQRCEDLLSGGASGAYYLALSDLKFIQGSLWGMVYKSYYPLNLSKLLNEANAVEKRLITVVQQCSVCYLNSKDPAVCIIGAP